MLAVLLPILCVNGMRWFDFFDMSPYLDAGYRLATGQRLYRDFFYHAGPLHAYLHAFYFKLLGFNEYAILTHLCVGATVAAAVTYFVALPLGRAGAATLSLVAGLCFYGPVSHPWHDQNAFVWVFLAAALLRAQETKQVGRKYALPIAAGMGILGGLAFLTKTNVGVGALAGFLAFFLALRSRREVYALCGGAALGILLPLLLMGPVYGYLDNSFLNYRGSDRFRNVTKLGQVLLTGAPTQLLLWALPILALGKLPFVKRERETLGLFLVLLFLGWFAAWTGSMLPSASLFGQGLALTLLCLLVQKLVAADKNLPRQNLAWAIGSVAVAATAFYAVMATDILLAWTWRRHAPTSDYAFKTPAMRHWRCDPTVCPGVDQAVDYINRNIPASDSLFVFPDVSIIYGLTHHESYPRSPVYFQRPAVGFEVSLTGPRYDSFRQHFTSSPPKWIVIHYQTEQPLFETKATLDWLGLTDWVREHSVKVWSGDRFEIRKLKS